jgi:RNA polymerase sigma factor (TIGR02999 family)
LPPTQEVTALLRAWSEGDEEARDALVPMVYAELHRLARLYMSRERPGQTLQPTALVHEAYLRLVDIRRVRWEDRAHFFAVSARVMRRVLVDIARSRRSLKRAGGLRKISFDEQMVTANEWSASLLALDDALRELAQHDLRKSQVVELRSSLVAVTPNSWPAVISSMLRRGRCGPCRSTREDSRSTGHQFASFLSW